LDEIPQRPSSTWMKNKLYTNAFITALWSNVRPISFPLTHKAPWMDKLHQCSCSNNFYIQSHFSSKFFSKVK
jgi:hypothetical protein